MKKRFFLGIVLLILFVDYTLLVSLVDVKTIGPNNSLVGFSTMNAWFQSLVNSNLTLYKITDYGSIIPIGIGCLFGLMGLIQWIKRKKLFDVDFNILILGLYFILLFIIFIVFIIFPLNYRPVLIDGVLESSYPSSTTLLSISFSLASILQFNKYIKNKKVNIILHILTTIYMLFLVVGRIISGVHWLSDIIGSVLLSVSLFYIYYGITFQSLKE